MLPFVFAILTFLPSLHSCKTADRSELSGFSKVKKSSSNSICSQTLGNQWQRTFGKITECSIERGCISGGKKGVYCKLCSQNDEEVNRFGAYRYPYGTLDFSRKEIYFCERFVAQNPNSESWDESFLEEAYHSITICPRGKPASSALTEGLSYLNDLVNTKKIDAKEKECIACLAQELLAKNCALRAIGKNSLMDSDFESGYAFGITTASSSCGDYCPDRNSLSAAQTKLTPEYIYLQPFAKKAKLYCEEVDRTCGVN